MVSAKIEAKRQKIPPSTEHLVPYYNVLWLTAAIGHFSGADLLSVQRCTSRPNNTRVSPNNCLLSPHRVAGTRWPWYFSPLPSVAVLQLFNYSSFFRCRRHEYCTIITEQPTRANKIPATKTFMNRGKLFYYAHKETKIMILCPK